MAAKILIIDDDKSMRKGLKLTLEEKYRVATAENGTKAREILQKERIDVVLLDIGLPDIDGLDMLKKIIAEYDDTMVIMITAVEETRSVVTAIRDGAYDYLVKPVGSAEVLLTVKNAIEKMMLSRQIKAIQSPMVEKYKFGFVGEDKKIRKILDTAGKLSKSMDTPTLIVGESGAGKGMLARAIHYSGAELPGPFIVVNCGAIPKDLVESELFGYEGGSFTGACAKGRKGRFEEAAGGTVLLDEIGAMPLPAQATLLHVLEDREFTKVGGTKSIPLCARVVSATNTDIDKAIRDGRFRQDLFYRLNVVMLEIPPLRERPGDILMLTEYFMAFYNDKFGKKITSISPAAEDILHHYHWPGNVRELKNAVERIILLEEGDTILAEYLPFASKSIAPQGEIERYDVAALQESYNEKYRTIINNALEETNNNIQMAAGLLKLPVHKLRYQIKKLGIKNVDR